MKAIISVSRVSPGVSTPLPGVSVQMLGIGEDERAARIAAYAQLHSGHNDFDEEYQGGQLINVAPELVALHRAWDRDGWQDAYDEGGNLAGSESTETHLDLLAVYSQLCITQKGELSSPLLGAIPSADLTRP